MALETMWAILISTKKPRTWRGFLDLISIAIRSLELAATRYIRLFAAKQVHQDGKHVDEGQQE